MKPNYFFSETELATLKQNYKKLRILLSAERLVEATRPRKDLAVSPRHGYHNDGVPIVGVTVVKRNGKPNRYKARIRFSVCQNGKDTTLTLGVYDSADSAGWAYRVAHHALWGDCSYCTGEEDNAVRQVYRMVAGE